MAKIKLTIEMEEEELEEGIEEMGSIISDYGYDPLNSKANDLWLELYYALNDLKEKE